MRSQFGGSWTDKKLEILASYLNSYTTALKNKPFNSSTFDAFAGENGSYLPGATGYTSEDYEDFQEFRAGSPTYML